MLHLFLLIGFDLIICSTFFMHFGHLIGDRHIKVLDVSHPALFWMGRDRIVWSTGKAIGAVGVILLLAWVWFFIIGAIVIVHY